MFFGGNDRFVASSVALLLALSLSSLTVHQLPATVAPRAHFLAASSRRLASPLAPILAPVGTREHLLEFVGSPQHSTSGSPRYAKLGGGRVSVKTDDPRGACCNTVRVEGARIRCVEWASCMCDEDAPPWQCADVPTPVPPTAPPPPPPHRRRRASSAECVSITDCAPFTHCEQVKNGGVYHGTVVQHAGMCGCRFETHATSFCSRAEPCTCYTPSDA